MKTMRGSEQLFNAILFTAEEFLGTTLSPRLLKLLDPTDSTRCATIRRSLEQHKRFASNKYRELLAAGNTPDCAARMVVEAMEKQRLSFE